MAGKIKPMSQIKQLLILHEQGNGKKAIARILGISKNTVKSYLSKLEFILDSYFNIQKLMLQITMSRLEGSLLKYFDKLSKTDLIILDDFGLTHLEQQHQMDLLEIIEDRHAKKATIIASHLPVSGWYDIIAEKTVTDAFWIDWYTPRTE